MILTTNIDGCPKQQQRFGFETDMRVYCFLIDFLNI
jgi:hypothetical protein